MYKTIWNDTLELIRKTNQFDANTFRFFETDTYIYNIENNTATIIAPQILTQQILLKNGGQKMSKKRKKDYSKIDAAKRTMNDMFDMAGMQLPEYLGKPKAETAETVEAE